MFPLRRDLTLAKVKDSDKMCQITTRKCKEVEWKATWQGRMQNGFGKKNTLFILAELEKKIHGLSTISTVMSVHTTCTAMCLQLRSRVYYEEIYLDPCANHACVLPEGLLYTLAD